MGGIRSDAVGPEEQVVFVAPLLNRFPSIDGVEVEEDGEEQLQGGNAPGVVHEEAAAEIADDEDEEVGVGERWSRASSEPDQVWYRWV